MDSSNVVSIATTQPEQELPEHDVRASINEIMTATARLPAEQRFSQARIARESGVAPGTLSSFMSANYPGDNAAIERKLLVWLEAYNAKRAHNAMLPVAPGYQPTDNSEKVMSALRYAQAAQDVALVYGGAGLGKTRGIEQYARSMPNVFHVTMTPAHSSVVTALQEIAEVVGAATGGGAAALHRGICKALARTEGLLVIDEAQHLSVAALDQIRSIHDAVEIGLALVGNEQVYTRMTGGNRAAYLDRLFSRIGRKVRISKAGKKDIHMLIAAWGITDASCRQQLEEIASKPGALRGLNKVLRLAAMYAAAQERALCCDDVRAAWRELGGAE